MKKYLAEFIGTFTLVFFGCGTAVVAGERVGFLGIGLAFGLALIAMAYGIGPISGCHINPAVSLGVFTARRMNRRDLIGYIVAQVIGAFVAAIVLAAVASGRAGYSIGENGLGQNGWGPGMFNEYNFGAALIFELVASFLFVVVVLGSTGAGAPATLAGLAIGLALAAIHIFGIPITGTSVNPARSLGPALVVGGKALAQVWLFLVIPSLSGIVAGWLFRTGILESRAPAPSATMGTARKATTDE